MSSFRKIMRATKRVHGPLSLLFFLLPLLLTGCFTKSFRDIRPDIESRGHYIENVPFVRQGEYDCGPAALASVFGYWKHPTDISKIATAVYIWKLHGTLPMDMERYVKDAGFLIEFVPRNRDSVRSSIRDNKPVICMLDLGFGKYRHPHYVTVIGFDDVNQVFIMHDGEQENGTMAYDSFETAWSRAGHWMMVVVPVKTE